MVFLFTQGNSGSFEALITCDMENCDEIIKLSH